MFKPRFLSSPTERTIAPSLSNDFTKREIAALANLGSLTHISTGDELISEGVDGAHAYLITTGSAVVERDGDVVATLSKGDMVGERALVTRQPRNATVVVRMPVTALKFDRHQFARLRSECPKVRALSDRLVADRG